MAKWTELLSKFGNPIARLEKYLLREKLISEDQNAQLRKDAKESVRVALKAANDLSKPSIDGLFDDVYETVPAHLKEQREALREHLRKYPDQYNLGNFKDGPAWIK